MNDKIKLWNDIKLSGLRYQESLETHYRKGNGIYYTGLDLAEEIIKDVFLNLPMKAKICDLTFFEPCGGIGNFIFCYLKYISENYNLNENELKILFNNIYYCEQDLKVQELYKKMIIQFAKVYFNFNLLEKNLNIGRGLIYDFNHEQIKYISVDNYFSINKFDIIVTNPPYKSLRAETRHYESKKQYEKDRKKYALVKEHAKKNYLLSQNGNPNVFKYFVEEIIKKYTHSNSIISVLIPSSILTDKSCNLLRKEIIENNSLKTVCTIPENNQYISANQALAYLTLVKGGNTDEINIIKMQKGFFKKSRASKKEVIDIERNYTILTLEKDDYKILSNLSKFPKIKDFSFIKNLRGELDLTLNADHIVDCETRFPLVKGRNIKKYELTVCENGWVNEVFVNNSAKKKFILNERIACQQISNANKTERLNFTYIPEKYVLGNSCNFIWVEENELAIDLYYLIGVLNSKILNWYFKLFSSNNHINNYEIDNLPLPIADKKTMSKISQLVKKNLGNRSDLIEIEINNEVNKIIDFHEYSDPVNKKQENELTKITQMSLLENFSSDICSDINLKIKKSLIEKKESLSNSYVMNNTTYKMSELDMEIIKSIPPGGNWKNIPQSTMEKSKRLLGIQKTGGRTTLYGRLDYNQPSYTITTYFNRPGNGCYIHPVQDRVLTTREAARLQCFPDDYYFFGNKKDILMQIGNAVPPIIGYLIGNKISSKVGVKKSLDLFSGAGGLLIGMKESGIEHVLANDISQSACVTLKVNNPEIDVLHGDITNNHIKQKLITDAKFKNVEVICGGPPCQGFSLAGFRNENDPRNQLFRDFYDVVKAVNPKVIVFENVVGLISYNKGETYREIKNLFDELGYNVEGRTLKFNEYGVPQKRNRVIVICVRKELNISPSELYPDILTKKDQITVKDAIGNLSDIKLDSNKEQVYTYNSKFELLISNQITYEEYCQYLENKKKSAL